MFNGKNTTLMVRDCQKNFKKIHLYTSCKRCLNIKTHKLIVKRWDKISHENNNHKREYQRK